MGRIVVILVVVGCGPVVGVDEAGFEGSSEGDTTSASATDDRASSSSDGVDSSGPPPPVCGDGIIDENETCDDGNVDDGDGCDSQCRVPGTELWETFLPPLSSCPRLAALEDGGVAIVGNEQLGRDASIPHVAVVDIDGSVRWSFQGGYGSHDRAMDVVADAGGFVVVGQGDVSPNGVGGWMQRWAADGTMVAEAILAMDELGDRISDVERRDTTSYWIVGRDDPLGADALLFRSFDEPPSSASTLPTAFDVLLARGPDEGAYVAVDGDDSTLTRFDRDGAPIWTLEFDAAVDSTVSAYALATTATGDAIVTGTQQGRPDSQWIRRFDPAGTELWRTTVDVSAVPSDDAPLHVAVDGADTIFVTGESRMEGGNDGFLAKYDGNGVELWQLIWGAEGDLNVNPCDIVATSDGSIVLAGTEFLAGENADAYWLRAFTP